MCQWELQPANHCLDRRLKCSIHIRDESSIHLPVVAGLGVWARQWRKCARSECCKAGLGGRGGGHYCCRACSSCWLPQAVALFPANLGFNPSFSSHRSCRPVLNMLQQENCYVYPICLESLSISQETSRMRCLQIKYLIELKIAHLPHSDHSQHEQLSEKHKV